MGVSFEDWLVQNTFDAPQGERAEGEDDGGSELEGESEEDDLRGEHWYRGEPAGEEEEEQEAEEEEREEQKEEEKEEEKEVKEEKKVLSLTELSAKLVVEKYATSPQLYANTLASIPTDAALHVVSSTPPSCVECLIAFRNLQIERAGQSILPVVNLQRLIYTINQFELQFLTLSKDFYTPSFSSPSRSLFTTPLFYPFLSKNNTSASQLSWSDPLIDIWANYSTFILEPRSEEEDQIGKICFSSPMRPNVGEKIHSVSDEVTFKKNFDIFTEHQFDGWNEWENMVVVGGSVVASLLPLPDSFKRKEADYFHNIAYPTSDIDIYIYGLEIDAFAAKVDRLYKHLVKVNGEVLVVRTTFTVTFCSSWPKRHIQIVIGKWNNIPEVLFEPDVDCTCVAFDGSRVWATQRSRFSYNFRCIVASNERYNVRGFPEYESRLLKYGKRGFNIWYLPMAADFSNISLNLLFVGLGRISEHQTIEGRAHVTGLRLLLVGYLWPKLMAKYNIRFFKEFGDIANMYKDEGLPYGPKWNLKQITNRLAEPVHDETNYGPCEVESPYILVKDIIDWQSIVSPYRDKLIDMHNNSRQNRRGDLCFHNFVNIARDTKDMAKIFESKKTNEMICCYCVETYPYNEMFVVYPLDMFCACCKKCKEEDKRTKVPTTHIPAIPAPASALFMHRAGDPRAQELARAQGVHLEMYDDDPYKDYEYSFLEHPKFDLENPLHKAILCDDVYLLRKLCASQLNATFAEGNTALHYAAMAGKDVATAELLRAGANVDACNARGMTPLHYACEDDGRIACTKQLLAHGANPNAAQCGLSPIYITVANWFFPKTLRLLLKHGANVEGMKAIDKKAKGKVEGDERRILPELKRKIALFEQIHTGTVVSRTKQWRLYKRIDEDAMPELYAEELAAVTPLHIAAAGEWDNAVAVLAAFGADLNARGPYGLTPLALSVFRHPDMPKELIKIGVDVDARNDAGETALFLASSSGEDEDVAAALIEAGADVNAERHDGHTPLTIAVLHKHELQNGVLRYATEKGLPVLTAAATKEITDEAKQLLPIWACISQLRDRKKCTPLGICAENGNAEFAKMLLDNRSDPNVKSSSNGRRPLHLAAQHGQVEMMKLLLAYNAICDPPPPRFSPPASEPEEEPVEHEIDLHSWVTPLHLAIENGHEHAVRLLILEKCTLLPEMGYVAVRSGNAAILDLVMTNCPDMAGDQYLLFLAAQRGSVEMLEVMETHGMDARRALCDGMTALHGAAMGGCVEVVKWLVEKRGVDINGTTEERMTALHFAAEQGKTEVVEYLMQKGADINAKNLDGLTPFTIAVDKLRCIAELHKKNEN